MGTRPRTKRVFRHLEALADRAIGLGVEPLAVLVRASPAARRLRVPVGTAVPRHDPRPFPTLRARLDRLVLHATSCARGSPADSEGSETDNSQNSPPMLHQIRRTTSNRRSTPDLRR